MSALTLVEDLATVADIALVVGLVAVAVIAACRGIKIIVVHRRNGEEE